MATTEQQRSLGTGGWWASLFTLETIPTRMWVSEISWEGKNSLGKCDVHAWVSRLCFFYHLIKKRTSSFKICLVILNIDNCNRETRNLNVAPAVGHSPQELWHHWSGARHFQSQTYLWLSHSQSLLESGLISLKVSELRGLYWYP